MSKKKKPKAKKKKATPAAVSIPTFTFEPKSQFEMCQDALQEGRIANSLLKFYSPISGEHCASACVVDNNGVPEMGIKTEEDYGLTVETLRALLAWAEKLQQPAEFLFSVERNKISEYK